MAPEFAAPDRLPLDDAKTVVTPTAISADLLPGAPKKVSLTVRTASTPIPKVDVAFAFDVTSSMAGVIDQAEARGSQIMNGLHAEVADSTFGVGSFCDFPGTFSSPGYSATYGGPNDYS